MNNQSNRPSRRPARAAGKPKFAHRKFNGGKSSSRPNRGGGGGTRRGRGGGRKNPTFDPSQFINKNPTETKQESFKAEHTFADFKFSKSIQEQLDKMGIVDPSPIQDIAIPAVLEGKDVVGLAETGTGKTAAFLLPIIEKTLADKNNQALILAPTRELAIQIEQELRKLTWNSNPRLFSVVCVGGTSIHPQIRALRKPNHFIIGTPGRVKDLIQRGLINPAAFTTAVLDEADRMLDMGFVHDMRDILKDVPASAQTLFFSATMNKEAEKLVSEFLKKPVVISVKKKDVTNSIYQDVVKYSHHDKFETLHNLLKKDDFSRVIIFGAMKHSVQRLSDELNQNGVKSTAIHGNKSHPQRQAALRDFKAGKARVLVATDVAARGIHVDDVSHVINYDLPQQFEDYVHRIGRTGRGDKKGVALTFVQG